MKAWVDTVQKINSSDSDLNFGMVALAGEDTLFDNVQIGRDTDSDGVIDDLVLNDTFSGTSVTTSHDNNGNLTFDGTYRYSYNAWNELVKATLDDADVVIHQAEFYANGRRASPPDQSAGPVRQTSLVLFVALPRCCLNTAVSSKTLANHSRVR